VLKDTIAFARVVEVGIAFDGDDGVSFYFFDDAAMAHSFFVLDDEDGAGFDKVWRHKLLMGLPLGRAKKLVPAKR